MKRNHEIKIRFNDDEFKILNNKLEKTSLSREAFSRACILGKEIKVPPDLEYYKLKNEFNHIVNNLNQIARALNNRQDISLKVIEVTIKELRQMIKNLDEILRKMRCRHGVHKASPHLSAHPGGQHDSEEPHSVLSHRFQPCGCGDRPGQP